VANPPYVADGDAHLQQGDLRFEPHSALASGVDGLSDLQQIIGGHRSICMRVAGCCWNMALTRR